jgi:S-adenosylmethionine hydrolase
MIITLLTDFGLSDHYVAAMKGVILSICPDAQLVDISHEVTPYSILEAGYTLAQAVPCFPRGTIHLVVVDPGVGSQRRPLLAEAGQSCFVCPDNGVLTMTLSNLPERTIRHITAERFFRHPVSHTFHGRDLFAPVAAHLASGVRPSEFGVPIQDYVELAGPKPQEISPGHWVGHVLKIDKFGNIITNFDWETFHFLSHNGFEFRLGHHVVLQYREDYISDQSGLPFALRGSAGFVEISLKQEHAARFLGVRAGAGIDLRTEKGLLRS